jgi:YfiH family protein
VTTADVVDDAAVFEQSRREPLRSHAMTTHARPLPDRTLPASIRTAGALRLLTWPALDASGADAAVTARDGGVSSGPYATLNLSLSVGDDPARVLENRRRLAAGLGVDPGAFVFARQVHGAGVRVVGEADRGSGAFRLDDAIADTDALVTTSPGVVLAILTADCVPIVLHDPVARVLACVHAGWRGTAADVTAAAVAAMQALGSRPSDILAGVGPAIAPARYQVGPDVHQAVTEAFGPAANAFLRPDPQTPGPQTPGPQTPDRWLLNLWAANRHALLQSGVPAPQIHITNLPTGPTAHLTPTGPTHPTGSVSPKDPPSLTHPANPTSPTSPGHFFSDRAARPCGRLALVARLRAPGQSQWV